MRVVWRGGGGGGKSLGLSSESKSVGKSMGPSGSRRGGFVGLSGPRHTATEGSFSATPAEHLRALTPMLARVVQHNVRAWTSAISCPSSPRTWIGLSG